MTVVTTVVSGILSVVIRTVGTVARDAPESVGITKHCDRLQAQVTMRGRLESCVECSTNDECLLSEASLFILLLNRSSTACQHSTPAQHSD